MFKGGEGKVPPPQPTVKAKVSGDGTCRIPTIYEACDARVPLICPPIATQLTTILHGQYPRPTLTSPGAWSLSAFLASKPWFR
jgi:hypothetical protein